MSNDEGKFATSGDDPPNERILAILSHQLKSQILNITILAYRLWGLLEKEKRGLLEKEKHDIAREYARDLYFIVRDIDNFLDGILAVSRRTRRDGTRLTMAEVVRYLNDVVALLNAQDRPDRQNRHTPKVRLDIVNQTQVSPMLVADTRALMQIIRLLLDSAIRYSLRSDDIVVNLSISDQGKASKDPTISLMKFATISFEFHTRAQSFEVWNQRRTTTWAVFRPGSKEFQVALAVELAKINEWDLKLDPREGRGTAEQIVQVRLAIPVERSQ